MASRKCGDARVRITYHDDGTYKGTVSAPGVKPYRFTDLRAPAAGLGRGVAYDSPRAYDEMARAAVSFASYDVQEIADAAWDHDERSGEIRCKRR